MAVLFTSNIGLAKPTESELAKNWTINPPALADDNNILIETNSDFPTLTYTPVLNALTTPPSAGAGSRLGQYQDIHGYIMGTFKIEFLDPGVSVGNGFYGISLPVPGDGAFHTIGNAFDTGTGSPDVIGEGYILDISAVATSGTVALDLVTVGGISYVRILTELFTTPAKTSRLFTNGMPFSLATGDAFSGWFVYKKA